MNRLAHKFMLCFTFLSAMLIFSFRPDGSFLFALAPTPLRSLIFGRLVMCPFGRFPTSASISEESNWDHPDRQHSWQRSILLQRIQVPGHCWFVLCPFVIQWESYYARPCHKRLHLKVAIVFCNTVLAEIKGRQ
jgi:hypothetical protein